MGRKEGLVENINGEVRLELSKKSCFPFCIQLSDLVYDVGMVEDWPMLKICGTWSEIPVRLQYVHKTA